MITGLQLAILSGGLVGLGAVLLVARLLPVEPDLADALERVSSTPISQRDGRRTPLGPARSGSACGACASCPPVCGFVRRLANSPCSGSRSRSSTARS